MKPDKNHMDTTRTRYLDVAHQLWDIFRLRPVLSLTKCGSIGKDVGIHLLQLELS